MESELKGPFLYNNWISKLNNESIYCTYEFPLFSDAYLTGDITDILNPYYLINTVPIRKINIIAPVIIFRADIHLKAESNIKDMKKTDTSAYHGGWINDEMAALLSLCLGVRIKSGGVNRYFDSETDPKGRPEYHYLNEDPIFIKQTHNQYTIPNAVDEHCINDAVELSLFPKLNYNEATIVIKSARLYQEGLWLSESEPELSWLLFVSAIETAANFWYKSKLSTIERLKYFNIDLFNLLMEKNDEKFTKSVADKIANYIGATKKFVDFTLNFLPDPPENRPNYQYGQFNWDRNNIEQSLKIIYGWRSQALHSGVPFPKPMCDPPIKIAGKFCETIMGLATGSKQGVWLNKDTPMLLHLFEYITRKSLLKWWKSLIKE